MDNEFVNAAKIYYSLILSRLMYEGVRAWYSLLMSYLDDLNERQRGADFRHDLLGFDI